MLLCGERYVCIRVTTATQRRRYCVATMRLQGGECCGTFTASAPQDQHDQAHSLFRQGSMLYELMPNMTDFLLLPLIERFAQMLAAQPLFAQMFGAI
jgi:hypothetical protein